MHPSRGGPDSPAKRCGGRAENPPGYPITGIHFDLRSRRACKRTIVPPGKGPRHGQLPLPLQNARKSGRVVARWFGAASQQVTSPSGGGSRFWPQVGEVSDKCVLPTHAAEQLTRPRKNNPVAMILSAPISARYVIRWLMHGRLGASRRIRGAIVRRLYPATFLDRQGFLSRVKQQLDSLIARQPARLLGRA